MGRRPRGERVLGPYRDGNAWRVVHVGPGPQSERVDHRFATEDEARQFIAILSSDVGRAATTVAEALDLYETHIRDEKGNKEGTVYLTMHRLSTFFTNGDLSLAMLTPRSCEKLYAELRARTTKRKGEAVPISASTHQNTLAEAKTFLGWCVERRYISRSPLAAVKPLGHKRHGKEQLRLDEARKFYARAMELADFGDEGAIAALVALLLGLRASEIVGLRARDVDDGGKMLWVEGTKTNAARRRVDVDPEGPLPVLLAELAKDKAGDAPIFGFHWRDWPRKQVARICGEAKVPVVTAHAMRGLASSIAAARGQALRGIADALGHERSSTTATSYVQEGVVEGAERGKLLVALRGGRRE